MILRQPAVAGRFYPSDPGRLRQTIDGLLSRAQVVGSVRPKALIAPHAGYPYSGAVAASAFASLGDSSGSIRRVVLLGTAHSRVVGLATSRADGFQTPLGVVEIDREGVESLLELPQVAVDEKAHRADHALEVELPFLQHVIGCFSIVPLLVGRCRAVDVAEVLGRLWGGDETLIVVSSDLSHYHPGHVCRQLDRETADAIVALDPDRLGPSSACGRRAIAGLLIAARERGLVANVVDLRHSGDAGGPDERVVGYGAFLFHEEVG